MYVEDEETLDLFDGAGAVVDRKKNIVKVPSHLVEDAIISSPEVYYLAGRERGDDVVLQPGRVGYTNFGEALKVSDPETRQFKAPTKKDLEDCTRLLDYLEHVEVIERPMGCHDVHPDVAALHNAEAILNNTTKHVFIGPQNGYLARKITDMVTAIIGGRDRLAQHSQVTFFTCPVSPLKLPKDACEIIIEGARTGMGVGVLSQVMVGGTGPVTMGGTLVMHNVEVLFALVLSQLVKKGSPFMYSSSTCSIELRYGAAAVGTPETAIMNAAIVQIAKQYLLPVWTAGG
jgi:trimethylamine--corrinoid protein Co-methyltransferase